MSSLAYGLFSGILLAAFGAVNYLGAPRIGPNRFFGIRSDAGLRNPQVWAQSNRVGGLIMMACGALIELLSVPISMLWPGGRTGFVLVTALTLVAIFGSLLWTVAYAERLGRGEGRGR